MPSKMPLHLVWALTNACNIRCIHCYAASARRSSNELSHDEILSQIDVLARDGLLDLALSGGEPLLIKRLENIVERAANSGITVGMGTNGWALTKKRAKSLASAGISRIQVSLDGLSATHDIIRRRAGLFDRAKQGILNSKEVGIQTKVCFTVHRSNWEQLQEVFNYCVELGVDGFNLSQLVPTGRGAQIIDLRPNEWKQVLEWWNSTRKTHPNVQMTTHLAQLALVAPDMACSPLFQGCQAGQAQGAISATGDIYPCVVLPYSLGNIRKTSIKTVWNESPQIMQLRDRSRLTGSCQTCPVKNKCGGCRATAYALTGDLNAADPHCWLDYSGTA